MTMTTKKGAVTAPAPAPDPTPLERLFIQGDLASLGPDDRVRYYLRVCESLGLNPATQPFAYLTLKGRGLVLYARKDATEQLRRLHRVSVQIVARERQQDVYLVVARATLPDGRHDESVGAVSLQGLKGEDLANAYMKAETKSKRRVTLSICGLGMLDETEVVDVPPVPPAALPALPAPHRGDPAPALKNGNGDAAPPTEDGPALMERVRRTDAELAKKGWCLPGELLDHVAASIEDTDDPASWAPETIRQARDAARLFWSQAKEDAAAPVSDDDRQALARLLAKKGKALGAAEAAAGVKGVDVEARGHHTAAEFRLLCTWLGALPDAVKKPA
jgi:hypothetical protein